MPILKPTEFAPQGDSLTRKTVGEIPTFLPNLDGKILLEKLVWALTDTARIIEMQNAGFFGGNVDADIVILDQLHEVGGDDPKFIPALLEAIHRSRGMAILRLETIYPDMSINDIEDMVRSGEISDPYPMAQIEAALSRGLMPAVKSIILFDEPTLIGKPEWWGDYSDEFVTGNLTKYVGFTEQ